ncbi:MAG: hypothetical protein AAGA99_00435 [Actinomycetota bacterium]
MSDRAQCQFITKWGRCCQPASGMMVAGLNLCRYHLNRIQDDWPHDEYYHRKIAEGLLEPTWSYLNPTELDVLMGQRLPRYDGRRTDVHGLGVGTHV